MNEPQELIEFPCHFPIKVMGLKHPDFAPTIAEVIKPFDPTFDVKSITTRDSAKGNYQGLNVVVHTTSREHLDNIYRALTSHPMVKVVL